MNGIESAFIGRLGRDAELKTSQAGKPWAALSVGVGEGEEVQWVRVAVFGTRAQELAPQLHKGDRVYVEGRLKLGAWTGQDGQQRTGINVAAWKVERLGNIGHNKPTKPKTPEWEQAAAAPVSGPADYQRPLDNAGGGRMPIDDTIPFGAEVR